MRNTQGWEPAIAGGADGNPSAPLTVLRESLPGSEEFLSYLQFANSKLLPSFEPC